MPRQHTCRTGARDPRARTIAHRFCATPRTKKLKISPCASRRAAKHRLQDHACTPRRSRESPQRRPGMALRAVRGCGMGAGIEQFNVVLRTCACVRACGRVFDMMIHRWFEARSAQLDPHSHHPRFCAHQAHTATDGTPPSIFEARGAAASRTAANTLKPPKSSTVSALPAGLRPAGSQSWHPSLARAFA